jgi:superkiller protein 3
MAFEGSRISLFAACLPGKVAFLDPEDGAVVDSTRQAIPPSPALEAPSGLSPAEVALYRQGHAARKSGRPGEAIAAYRQLVSRRPDLADLWADLAALYAQTGASEHALQAYRQRVQLRPGDSLAWHNLAVLLEKHSRPAEAAACFREALKGAPEMSRAWYGLGQAHRRLAQHDEALAAFRQAVRLDSAYAQAWCRLGQLLEHNEDYAEAIRAYRQAVRHKPGFAAAWYGLGVLLRDDGQLPQAVDAFLEALRLLPHDIDAWVGLGIAYSLQKNRRGVLDVYEELAIIDVPAAEAFAQRHVIGHAAATPAPRLLPAPPQAVAHASGAPSPGSHPLAEMWYEMGVAHRRQGDLAEAISDFAEAVRFDPDHGKAWFCLAALYRATRRLDDALQALKEVVRIKPALTVAWRDLAAIHALRGHHQKAITALRMVIEREPDNAAAWLALGRACIGLENTEGLANVLEKLRGLDSHAAEKLAHEYAQDPIRHLNAKVAPVAAPAAARAAAADLKDTNAFDAWLLTIDHPPVAAFEAALQHTA